MIEVRINLVDIGRIKNRVLHNIAFMDKLKSIGIPTVGVLLMEGVSSGHLTVHVEEDLDGDLSVIRWWTPGEPACAINEKPADPYRRVAGKQLEGWSWVQYSAEDPDDEL